MRRLLVATTLGLALLPAQCLREQPLPPNMTVGLTAKALSVPQSAQIARGGADIALDAAWVLTSPHSDFGSLSGLAIDSMGRLVAVSDQGVRVSFNAPPEQLSLVFETIAKPPIPKTLRDVEAVAFDTGGREWIAFEGANRLARRGSTKESWETIRTPNTVKWPSNGGAETMTFLNDGRLLLIEESIESSGGQSRALLYAGSPEDAAPTGFTYAPPPGYLPTDAATLPDGRVLIMLRAVRYIPPGFVAKIVLANPERIRAGQAWRGREIARIAAPAPVDNMEGIAVSRRNDGAFDLWLVSDDNGVSLQRTLLLRLIYRPPPIRP